LSASAFVRLCIVVAVTAIAASLSACGNISYYAQQARGHVAMLQAARPVTELISDASTEPALKAKLETTQRIRAYASDTLGLPRNASYTRYADLKRPNVLWNVVATPELSLEAKQWCFIVAGCITYRGYYDKAAAETEVAALQAQGFDVALQGVPAYSTLGKLSWLGAWSADPLLNTFITYPEGELARLIFHELSHQVVYVQDDSTFNESFATAVEQLGVTRYLDEAASANARSEYAAFGARREDFRALLLATHNELKRIYESAQSDDSKRREKATIFTQLKAKYEALKQSGKPHWRNTDGTAYLGYDRYFAQALNNAHVAGIATYNAQTANFERLFEQEGRSFEKFFVRVKALAALPAVERKKLLEASP
jgi:predicted aminopeptidase